ncbi:Putative beta-glucuronidase [Neolewinella maritima]|uniref:Beta-glucuronidase n=1 Tax=Neolewinella maritima TaxID=1383882 RepID=A0ABN8FAT4_9BACT|nr:glycoside hydrolase family 2 TIM barrel-domain containing protein [Neolewinella maritima]CAH1002412.1 Putative beta-glucuronidase [Neolewinella maritima]
MYHTLLLAFLTLLTADVFAADTLRHHLNLNADWQYLAEPLTDVADLGAATDWEPVTLPHTWNQWDAVDDAAGYRRDASWYRKTLPIRDYGDARYLLYFEGSNITTEVYVNGQRAGGHVGGYVGFRVDITDFITPGADNTLAIRVDNGYNPDVIPSQKSDFFIYGGITRDLWLDVVPATYLVHTHVSTPEVTKDRARTQVQGRIQTATTVPTTYRVKAAVIDPDGTQLSKIHRDFTNAGDSLDYRIDLPEVTAPRLWSPASPDLYTLLVEVYEGDRLIDTHRERYGYRFYRFEPNGAFYLNGERLLLRGTHRHEEHAGLGAAMPDSLHRRDMEMIREMGGNFVRLGHYPQDPEVYRACDSLGLIVWDELPWCRGGKGGPAWEANTQRLLEEQIVQNYNHPSIFFWSLGNELYWLPDFEGGDDTEGLNTFLRTLNQTANRLDPYRFTAMRKYYEGAGITDVFSPSIWSGWYAGVYSNYARALEDSRQKYPRFLHMEYGGSSHIGRHTENPITGEGSVAEDDWAEAVSQVGVTNIAQTGDWTENYIVDLFDWHLRVSETTDWFAGNAQWAFKDFGTPLRPENPIPYLNQKGLVDRAGNLKDAYYVFKSYWSDDPFAWIESHTWTERSGPEGKEREVSVFSNGEEVEFFHNGTSLGRKTKDINAFPASGLHWPVDFTAGANTFEAVAYRAGAEVARDTLTVNYTFDRAGTASRIVLSHRALANGNVLVEAIMQDSEGRRVLDYEGRVYFDHSGPGKLLVDWGLPTRSQVIEMANGRAAIELVPAAGRTVIEARNQDFKGSYLVIEAGDTTKR